MVEPMLLSGSSTQISFNKLSMNSVKWTSVQNMRQILQAIKSLASQHAQRKCSQSSSCWLSYFKLSEHTRTMSAFYSLASEKEHDEYVPVILFCLSVVIKLAWSM